MLLRIVVVLHLFLDDHGDEDILILLIERLSERGSLLQYYCIDLYLR